MRLDRPMLLSGVPEGRRETWTAFLVLIVAALMVRAVGLNRPPLNDELYTLLAARSWLQDGTFHLAGAGVYDRAGVYTIFTAGFLDLFGDSLVVARLPAVLAGILLVIVVFLWTRAVADSSTAWIAALFMAFSPLSIQESQFARFYALHALLFWLAAMGAYALVEQDLPRRTSVAVAIGSLACLSVAYHLTPLTVIGVLGLGVWFVATVALPRLGAQRQHPRRLWTIVGLAAALLFAGAFVMVESGIAQELWHAFRYAPLHALPRANQVWFYQLELIQRYPTLWPVFPFLALLAAATRPRVTLLCCCIFIPAFVLLSLAAMKHFNYIFFILPFLFVIWAISLASVITALWRWISAITDSAVALVAPGLPRRATTWALITAGLIFLVFSNGAPARTILKPFGVSLTQDERSADWAAAADALQPWLRHTSVILTPDDMQALYYMGDYDIAVNPSRLSEVPNGHEFSVDPRTGRPVVGTAASLELIMSCYDDGVLVADFTSFPAPWLGSEPLTEVIRSTMTPIALPRGTGVYAFRWNALGDAPAPPACAALPAARRPR